MIDWMETDGMMLGYVGSEIWFKVHKPTANLLKWSVYLTRDAPEDIEAFEHDAPNQSINFYSATIIDWFGIKELLEESVREYHAYTMRGAITD